MKETALHFFDVSFLLLCYLFIDCAYHARVLLEVLYGALWEQVVRLQSTAVCGGMLLGIGPPAQAT